MGGKRVFAVDLIISSIDGKVGARLQRSLFRDAVVDLCAVHAKCAVIVKKQASESQERSSVQSSRIQELRIRVDVDGYLGWRVQAVDRSHVTLERGDQGVGRDRDGVHGEASLAGDGHNCSIDGLRHKGGRPHCREGLGIHRAGRESRKILAQKHRGTIQAGSKGKILEITELIREAKNRVAVELESVAAEIQCGSRATQLLGRKAEELAGLRAGRI